MRKRRFSEAQIIEMIKEQDATSPLQGRQNGYAATTGPETGIRISHIHADGR